MMKHTIAAGMSPFAHAHLGGGTPGVARAAVVTVSFGVVQDDRGHTAA